ncbi:MAG: hypothetical protein JO225_17795 [Candidatus Eremiobacteraeota bacterium]|nr:hypothetical protein [Candidatus Eremiobacteraeota bacterium]
MAVLHDATAGTVGRRNGSISPDARHNTRTYVVYRRDTDAGAINPRNVDAIKPSNVGAIDTRNLGAIDPSNAGLIASLNVGSPALRDPTTVPNQRRRRAHIRWRTCAGLPSRGSIALPVRLLSAAAPGTVLIAATTRHTGIPLKPGASGQERPACRSFDRLRMTGIRVTLSLSKGLHRA